MFNIFRSKNQKFNSKIVKLENAQLSKVIGGNGSTAIEEEPVVTQDAKNYNASRSNTSSL